MKKILLTIALMCFSIAYADAQIVRAEELEKYAKEKYGEKWVDAAENLASKLKLDKNKGITYVQVIEAPGKSAEQLYVLLNYWYTATFNDASSVIQLNDKELNTIIAQGYVDDIATHIGGVTAYRVGIKPVIKCDIKDGKVRVTYTVPYFLVTSKIGGGWVGIIAGDDKPSPVYEEKWILDECFPYVKNDGHKKTSSKALVMAHAYSNVVMDKIEECITNGLTGNEDEDW